MLWDNEIMPMMDSLVGHQLANYQIKRLVRRGGMASVYYGIDLPLQRPAAIKVIDDRYRGNSDYADRFVREARAMASWRHPNIPQIYQAGRENDYYFYAMEYIQGMDLEELLRRYEQKGELLPLEDVLLIGGAVAAALDYAHKKGAVHRDVKPSNILIAEDERILLTDFGLVLEVDKGTRGEVFGSPHYIAPEQARSSAEAVPQSDLYALGVILYELLVGRLPFDDPSPAALALKHMSMEPPTPRRINPDLSDDLEAVLLKALRKQPRERFSSGKELIDALEKAIRRQIVGKTPTQSGPPTPETLPILVGEPGTQVRRTVSQLRVADVLAEELLARTTASPSFDPLAQPQPQAAHVSETRARVFPERRQLPWMKAGIGCITVFALLGLVLAFGTALATRWVVAGRERPSRTAPAVGLPDTQATQGQVASIVTGTASEDSLPASDPTGTMLPPSPVPVLEPSPTEEIEFRLLLVRQKDDSLYVINQSTIDFPLGFLKLGTAKGQVQGDAWEVDVIRPGQCVVVWKKEGKPKDPKSLNCEVVGKRLERSGPEKFWETDFEVFYRDVRLAMCEKDQLCQIRFPSPP
jgi:serine/threonine protein kinase